MIPLRRKDLTRELALDLDIDHDVVDHVVRCYYSKIQKMMSSCEHLNIDIPELGRLKTLHYRVDKKLKKLIETRDNINPTESLRKYSIVNQLNMDIHKLKLLEEKLVEEKDRKTEIKKLRHGDYKNT